MNKTPSISISGRRIADDEPAYIVAELSANHNGDYDRAVALVKAAADAGADAVKLQTYTPDTMTIDCDTSPFQIGGGSLWAGRNLYHLYGEAQTPWDWVPKLSAIAHSLGIELYSTPFDITAVNFLEDMDMPAYKIASFELVDLPFLRRVAETGKPVILSTGMATLDEIDEAVNALRGAGAREIALLKCTSAYPAKPADMNLRAIPLLANCYHTVVGLSDHSPGSAASVAAIVLGARIIEKHLTLDRADGGADAAFSMEPDEFAEMVREVRDGQAALGRDALVLTESETAHRNLRRSLFAVADIKAGEAFTEQNVRSIRPGHGLAPKHLPELLVKSAAVNIPRGTPLQWEHVQQ